MDMQKLRSNWSFILAGLVLVLTFGFVAFSHLPKSIHHAAVSGIVFPSAESFRQLSSQTQLDDIKQDAKVDPVATWSFLKSVFLVNGQQVGNAHELAHLVGNGMYEKFGLDGITNCDDTFAFGCFHGVTEKLLVDQGTSVILNVQNRCLQIFPPAKSQSYTGCIHGMGHGLLTFEQFQVTKALTDCDLLDKTYENYCYDGVFMENATDMKVGEFDPAKPWEFCTAMDKKYQYNCARYQSQVFLAQFGSNISKIATGCADTTNKTLSTTCFESLGYYITQNATGNFQKIMDLCGQVAGEGKYHCMIGATREVAFQAYVDWQQTGQELCQSLPTDWQNQCGLNSQFRQTN